jgi:hypothetical protein
MMLPLRLISGDKLYFNILRCFFLKIKFQILAFPGLGSFRKNMEDMVLILQCSEISCRRWQGK